jgi:hypothetical protein
VVLTKGSSPEGKASFWRAFSQNWSVLACPFLPRSTHIETIACLSELVSMSSSDKVARMRGAERGSNYGNARGI